MTINTVGHVQRAVALAAVSSIGGFSGIIGAFTFISTEAPRYLEGYLICLSFLGASFLLTCVYLMGLIIENRARDAGKREHLRSAAQEIELADLHVPNPLSQLLTSSPISDILIENQLNSAICRCKNESLLFKKMNVVKYSLFFWAELSVVKPNINYLISDRNLKKT